MQGFQGTVQPANVCVDIRHAHTQLYTSPDYDTLLRNSIQIIDLNAYKF